MKKRSRQVTGIICKNIYLQVESNVVNAVQFFEGKDISVKNIIRQKKYAGNDGYPVIVDAELFEKANSMLKFNIENDWKYGIKKERKNIIHKIFYLKEATTVYADPFKNAEYLYSLIEVIK